MLILQLGLPSLEIVNAVSPSRKPKNATISSRIIICCFEFVDVSEQGEAALNSWMR